MRVLKIPLLLLWRIWFYILMAIPIVVLLPVLLVTIAKDSWYVYFFRIARIWATFVLYGMGFKPTRLNKATFKPKASYMFVANHQSMTDIMLMLYCVKNPFVFVGKKELAKIPLFGFFYKKTCILVDREDAKSRQAVFAQAQQRLQKGLSICIFPEGGVPEDEVIILDSFKDGAFRLAISHKIPIAPMVFYDNKKRFPFTFFKGNPGIMRMCYLPIIATTDFTLKTKSTLREQTRTQILNALLK